MMATCKDSTNGKYRDTRAPCESLGTCYVGVQVNAAQSVEVLKGHKKYILLARDEVSRGAVSLRGSTNEVPPSSILACDAP